MAHNVRITAADTQVTQFSCVIDGDLILVFATAAIEYLNNLNAIGNTEFFGVGKHTNTRPAWMTGYRYGAMCLAGFNDHRQGQVDAGKIKCFCQRFCNPKYQNVPVFSLDFTALENNQAVFVGECRIVGVKIVLTMFRQYEAINGYLFRAYPLAIVCYLCPTII